MLLLWNGKPVEVRHTNQTLSQALFFLAQGPLLQPLEAVIGMTLVGRDLLIRHCGSGNVVPLRFYNS